MDALFETQSLAGQLVGEELYGAQFVWNNIEMPCTHDAVLKNPPLMDGGYSPDTQTTVSVRTDNFGERLPKKGERCLLKVTGTNIFDLQVQTVTTSAGGFFLTILCTDWNQGS